MPSDLTIRKFEQPQTPDPKPRHEQVREAREKTKNLVELEPVLLDNGLTAGQNLDRSILAGFLGGTMDLVQLGADGLSAALAARSPDLPYTSKWFKEKMDLEESLGGEVIGGLMSPDPVSTGKALLLPVKALIGSGKVKREILERADEMFGRGDDGADILRETRLFKGANDEWLMYRRDPGQIKPEKVRGIIDRQFRGGIPAGQESFIEVSPDELIDDPQLFEMFPYLKNVTVRMSVKNKGTIEDPSYIFYNATQAKRGGKGDAVLESGRVNLYNASRDYGKWEDSATGTLYHELGHIIDAVEGIVPTGGGTGAISTPWEQRQKARVMTDLLDDLDANGPIEDWLNPTEDEAEFIMGTLEKHGLPPNKQVFDDLWKTYDQYAMGSGEEQQLIRSIADNAIVKADVRMEAALANMDTDLTALDQLDATAIHRLSEQRYFRLEGEARQRFNQYLSTRNAKDAEAIIERYARTGEAPAGMSIPVDLQDQIVTEPRKVDPSRFGQR